MLAPDLYKLGLNKGEAEIYACLLQFGDNSASEIARKTNIGRTNVYEYANALMKKGLISQYERKNKIFFRAEEPRHLRPIVDAKIREIKELDAVYSTLLPRLEDFFNRNVSRPVINFYVGEAGFEEIMSVIYEQNEDADIFLLTADLDNYDPPHPKYRNQILRKQIFTTLFANSGNITEFNKRDLRELRKTLLVGKTKLEIKQDMLIFEDTIIFGNLARESFSATMMKDSAFARLLK